MGSLPLLKAAGLQTAHNPFSGVSDGALRLAKNVVIAANGVIEPRRGHRQLSYTVASKSSSGGFFGSTAVTSFSSSLAYDTGSAFTSYTGTFDPVDNSLLRMKFVESKGNLYFNTGTGVKALETESGTPRDAGLPAPRLLTVGLNASGTGFPNNTQMAVRCAYWRKDDDGSEYVSPPSARYVVKNELGSEASIEVFVIGPAAALPDGTRLRFYRTDDSGGVSTDPGDEQFLFYEADPPAVSDESDTYSFDTLGPLGTDPLYTNPRTGSGILQANERPPIAKDVAEFGGRMWFANTTGPHRLTIDLLGYDSPDGVQANDTITVAGVTYTAKVSVVDYANQEFEIDGFATPSESIEFAARNLCRAVNHPDSGSTVFATYASATNAAPGKIVFESHDLGGSQFTVYASRGASWNPELPSSDTDAPTSDNNRLPHGLFYSKPDEPEAVPLLNYLLVGAKNKELLRAIPLRDKLFVFTEAGIYTVAGDEPFTVDLLDATTRLVAPDTAVVLNNQILCLTNQGFVAVSDAGVQILSRPIEDQLLPYLNAAMRPLLKRYAFALAHETDRTVEFWMPGAAADSQACTFAFVFNTITQTWTTSEVATGRTWGAVSPTDVRYYGGLDGKVLKERRDSASSDYADETQSVTITNYSGTTLTCTTTGIEVGDAFTVTKSGGEQSEVVTAVGASTITVANEILSQFQSGGTTIIEKAFESEVKWGPVAYDRPGTLKRFQYGTYHYARPTAFTLGYATYSTEQNGTDTSETLTRSTDGWGSNEWDSSAWGDPQNDFNVRHIVPMEKQRAAMLSPGFRIREARVGWKLLGLTLDTEETSERNSRG